jgi:DNA polymerase
MTGLDQRQLEILGRIGIDVWQLRGKTPEPGNEHQEKSGSESESIGDIAREISSCERCVLHKTRTRTVPGTGNESADWVFVGEAPGQNEDQQGLPFVGRAGQLLDAMLAALDMNRKSVFIANVIKCRPPGNRDPRPEEVVECEPYLHRQLEILKPKIIVALGRISAQALLKTSSPLGKLRGQVYQYGVNAIPMVVTYHPAYLLRSPQQKAKAWEDLLLARSIAVSGSQQSG